MQTKAKKTVPRTREGLTLLGGARRAAPRDYDPSILECFSNRHPELDAMVTLRCPEFTTLCPITGQPDFGELVVRYVPAAKLVESKSLKLYLFSFRNHGDFHEDVCAVVLKDLHPPVRRLGRREGRLGGLREGAPARRGRRDRGRLARPSRAVRGGCRNIQP